MKLTQCPLNLPDGRRCVLIEDHPLVSCSASGIVRMLATAEEQVTPQPRQHGDCRSYCAACEQEERQVRTELMIAMPTRTALTEDEARILELSEENTRLREMVRRYGWHRDDCLSRPDGTDCSCGFGAEWARVFGPSKGVDSGHE